MREASLGFYWFPRERDKPEDIFKIQWRLSLNSLCCSSGLHSHLLLQPVHTRLPAAVDWGQYHGHATLSPQYGNVAAASIYYAPASYYYYTPDLYYPPSSSWLDRHGPGYPQWCPTVAALSLSLT
jgi:hypothetical protein